MATTATERLKGFYMPTLYHYRIGLGNMAEQVLLFGVISLDTLIGMALGMAASPLLMRAIKVLRRRRKINRLLNEIAKNRANDISESNRMLEGVDD